jgi:hypothetical protein
MTRITITLNEQEKSALRALADIELRDPQDQAHYILRSHLAKKGLLRNGTTVFNPAPETLTEISSDKKG